MTTKPEILTNSRGIYVHPNWIRRITKRLWEATDKYRCHDCGRVTRYGEWYPLWKGNERKYTPYRLCQRCTARWVVRELMMGVEGFEQEKVPPGLFRRFYRLWISWYRYEMTHYGFCPQCVAQGRKWHFTKLRFVHARTQYHEYERLVGAHDQNWAGCMCKECELDYDDYWNDRWSEYHNSRG